MADSCIRPWRSAQGNLESAGGHTQSPTAEDLTCQAQALEGHRRSVHPAARQGLLQRTLHRHNALTGSAENWWPGGTGRLLVRAGTLPGKPAAPAAAPAVLGP